jgi:hypothetical protein
MLPYEQSVVYLDRQFDLVLLSPCDQAWPLHPELYQIRRMPQDG